MLLAGCAKQPPTLLNKLDQPQMGGDELRARVYQFVIHFSDGVESAASEITAQSSDREVRRNALLWQMQAIPASQYAAFQTDPLAALIDVWVLCAQMTAYFEGGEGTDVFQGLQPIAVNASRELEAEADRIASTLYQPAIYVLVRARVDAWVEEHPIESILFTRESTIPLVTAAVGSGGGSVFSTVGGMNQELSDLSDRIKIYSESLPKLARWEAELAIYDMLGEEGIESALADFAGISDDIERITLLLETGPELVANERIELIRALDAQRVAVMAAIDEQRIATLDAVRQERIAVFEELRFEGISVIEQIDITAGRFTEKAMAEAALTANAAIDHFYWRAVQLLAVLLVVMFIGGIVLIRMSRRPLAP